MINNLRFIFLASTFSVFTAILGSSAIAQAPAIQWQKSYGGSGCDGSNGVQRTPDGGYIAGGYSNSSNGQVTVNHGGLDCWVIKTDDTGKLIWQKSYGSTGDDQINTIANDINGGYIIAASAGGNGGDVTGNHGGLDAWIIKIDDTGKIIWQKVMGSSGFDFANCVVNTPDSGYLVVASAGANDGDISGLYGQNDVWVIRLNKTGGLLWDKVYGSSGTEFGFAGINTPDGGYIVAAQAGAADGNITNYRGGGADNWIIKLNDTGAVQWQKTYGGTGFEQAVAITNTPGGGYIFSSNTGSTDGQVTGLHGTSGALDIWVVDINDTGAIKWEKCFGSSGVDWSSFSLVRAFDGTFVASGMTTNSSGDVKGDHGLSDYWVFDIDTAGNLKWQECLGGTGFDTAVYLIQTPDSGFVVIGGSTSNSGQVSGNHGGEDFWMVKLYKQDTTNNTGVPLPGSNLSLSIYPNPATNELVISAAEGIKEVSISNLLGQTVLYTNYQGTMSAEINISGLNPGVYVIMINATEVRKFVKE